MRQKSTSHRRVELAAETSEVSIRAAELFTAADTLQARAAALSERVRLFHAIVALTREVFASRLYEVAEMAGRWRSHRAEAERSAGPEPLSGGRRAPSRLQPGR